MCQCGRESRAATLKQMEMDASRGEFALCSASLENLHAKLDQLRQEAAAL
jgi:hypothetical protein